LSVRNGNLPGGAESFFWEKSSFPKTLFPSFSDLFSYEWKGKIEEDSEVLMVRKFPPCLAPLTTLALS
jgi:hypothetical protein